MISKRKKGSNTSNGPGKILEFLPSIGHGDRVTVKLDNKNTITFLTGNITKINVKWKGFNVETPAVIKLKRELAKYLGRINSIGEDVFVGERSSTPQLPRIHRLRITSNGEVKRAISDLRISDYDQLIEMGEQDLFESGNSKSFAIATGPCTFVIAYNAKTKVTYVAHSYGSSLGDLEETLKKAKESFKKDQKDIVFIIGGGEIELDTFQSSPGIEMDREMKYQNLILLIRERYELIRQAQLAGYKIVRAFSHFTNVGTQVLFKPLFGALVLEQKKDPGRLRRLDAAFKDSAQLSQLRGGIDLTPAHLNVQTQNSNGEFKFHLDPAQLAQLQNTPGFVPVIINIQPMNDLREFLGIDKTLE